MEKGYSWYDSIFILLFLYLFCLQVYSIWSFTIDDMYISLRYARNWAEGSGLLWNPNASPVEGYSNFSFVALGALSLLVKINPVIILKIAGLIGLFFTSIFVFLIARFWFKPREALIPCIWLLLYKGQIIWSVSGLETTAYQALITGAVYCSFKGMGYQLFPDCRNVVKRCFFVFAGIMLSLAGMTRPEAPVLMVIFFILMCLDRPTFLIREYWKGVGLFILTLAIAFLPYFLWRWHYYGYFFPNPIYCKGLGSADSSLLDLNYLKLIWPFALIALPVCIGDHDKRYYFLWIPSLVYTCLLWNADPVVAFDNRLFLPAFTLLLPLALQGLNYLILICFKQKDYYKYFLYGLSVCMAFLFIPGMSLAEYRYFSLGPKEGEQLRQEVGLWLQSHVGEGESVVLADSGMIPYYSNLNFIDSYCLNNAIMAHYPKVHRYEQFCHQIMRDAPPIIILTSLIEHGKVLYTPSDLCLKTLLEKQKNYKLVKTIQSSGVESIYRYELFTK